MRNIIYAICLISWLILNTAVADIIKNYRVEVTVLEDGIIDVVETIEMDIDHKDVRLGIIRDIPSRYYMYKQEIKTPVDVLSVMRNGQPENYWVENYGGVSEVYTGAKNNHPDYYLPKGSNTYVIHWQSPNHIRSFSDYDELYFNAIGNNWAFPIEKSSVTLHLPDSVKEIQSAGYYGKSGSTHKTIVNVISPQRIEFTTPEVIGSGKGLTIATGFTQGIVPSIKMGMSEALIEKALSFFPGYFQPMHIVLLASVAVMFIYWCLGALVYVIRKPRSQRAFMVRFSPPSFSLDKAMALESKSYMLHESQFKLALLVDLARQKIIKFNDSAKTIHINDQQKEYVSENVSEGQVNFLKFLKTNVGQSLSYAKYNPLLESALKLLIEPTLKHGMTFYHSVVPFFYTTAFVLFIVTIIFASTILSMEEMVVLLFPFFGSLVLSYGLSSLLITFSGQSVIRDLFYSFILIFFGLIFSLAIFIVFMDQGLSFANSLYASLAIIIILVSFWFVLKLYGKVSVCVKPEYLDEQQQVLEFKHYLQYTKEAEYSAIAPNLFEEYLPYAIAFGVDHNWLKLYKRLYPEQYNVSETIGTTSVYHVAKSNAFSQATTAPSTSKSGGSSSSRSSGSGGGGSSGGGSGGGGGRGR